jgi:hypothetical protein
LQEAVKYGCKARHSLSFGSMATKELRFAVDEKGYKTLAPTLIGQTMSYWSRDNQLLHGKVTAAEVMRDRYGNPFIEVTIDEGAAAESAA